MLRYSDLKFNSEEYEEKFIDLLTYYMTWRHRENIVGVRHLPRYALRAGSLKYKNLTPKTTLLVYRHLSKLTPFSLKQDNATQYYIRQPNRLLSTWGWDIYYIVRCNRPRVKQYLTPASYRNLCKFGNPKKYENIPYEI